MNSDADTLTGGFPHSEMSGSKGALASPDLIAECHVLHRLVSPRHPPDALFALKNPHAQTPLHASMIREDHQHSPESGLVYLAISKFYQQLN